MARNRRTSNADSLTSHSHSLDAQDAALGSSSAGGAQELGSMYDYLAKIILIGPSSSGKSCILHRFLRGEWRALSSQTIGVEFGSKIIVLGSSEGGGRRTRIKLQLWDTAGTERFRAVSRSYYRGAAGALLVYDVASYASFAGLPTFLRDAKNLASPRLSVVLVGNKVDVEDEEQDHGGLGVGANGAPPSEYSATTGSQPSTREGSLHSMTSSGSFTQADSDVWGEPGGDTDDGDDPWSRRSDRRGIDVPSTPRKKATNSSTYVASMPPTPSSTTTTSSSTSTVRYHTGSQRATQAPQGREVDGATAARWASSQGIPVSLEASALTGQGVDQAFRRLAQMILTKIELGEIDPDDPQSGIQYGDAGFWGPGTDDGASIASNTGTGGLRRRKGKGTGSGKKGWIGGSSGQGLREWEAVFRLDRGRSRKRGCC